MARPNPWAAPVTSATCPSRPNDGRISTACELTSRRLLEDGPLLLEHPHLAAQPDELLPRGRGQAVPRTSVDLGPLHPLADRRLGQLEVAADLPDAPPGRAHHGDHLRLELVRELSTLPSSHLDLLRGVVPHIMVVRLTGSDPIDTVMAVRIDDRLIPGLYAVRNPEKPSHMGRETALRR